LSYEREEDISMNIPLLIPCFNQLTYLRNLINWFRFYSKGDIYILDNASSSPPLLQYLSQVHGNDNIHVVRFQYNEGSDNLRSLIDQKISKAYKYYIISDPDIMPHPSVPMDFLDVFRHCIDNLGYHHAGFCLKIDDLPEHIENRTLILNAEGPYWKEPVTIIYAGRSYRSYKAPIDTTFALYRADKGWEKPIRPEWNNSLRIFEAFHLPWYIDPHKINDEMDYYFRTARGPISIYGKTYDLFANYRPSAYIRLHITNEITRALEDATFVKEFAGYLSKKDRELLRVLADMKEANPLNYMNNDLMSRFSGEVLIFMREYIFTKAEQEEQKRS
jgi:hypothetical protein